MYDSSVAIISFIANLLPIYTHEYLNGVLCARSLRDGTILIPNGSEEDGQDPWVSVQWQGNPANTSDVLATQMASIALIDYVNFHCTGKAPEAIKYKLDHLSHHFTIKTGQSLYLPDAQDDFRIIENIVDIIKRYEPGVVIEALKKGLGV